MNAFSLALVLIRVLALYFFCLALTNVAFGFSALFSGAGFSTAIFSWLPILLVSGFLWKKSNQLAAHCAKIPDHNDATIAITNCSVSNIMLAAIPLLGLCILAFALPDLIQQVFERWQILSQLKLNAVSEMQSLDIRVRSNSRIVALLIRSAFGVLLLTKPSLFYVLLKKHCDNIKSDN